jgi:hypothetical protein
VSVPRDEEFGCRRADYIVESYVIVDHYTRITPVINPQIYAKGSHKDRTKKYLPADVKILTATVDDSVVDDAVERPNE